MTILQIAAFFLAFATQPEVRTLEARAETVAHAIDRAVVAEGTLFKGPDAEDDTRKLLARIVYLESRGDPRAVNPAGDAGLCQIRSLWWEGRTLAEILDPDLNVRLALRALRSLRARCGGTAERWLGAYASGTCGGARRVARVRCAPLKLCEAT